MDVRLTRRFELARRLALQGSWDAFNLFNRANITTVRTTQFSRSTSEANCGVAGTPCLVPQKEGATAFGTPTGALNARTMQLSVKLLF